MHDTAKLDDLIVTTIDSVRSMGGSGVFIYDECPVACQWSQA